MRKPNKIERMNAYLYAWAILTGKIEDPGAHGTNALCPKMCDYFKIESLGVDEYNAVMNNLPELKSQKPKGSSNWWWPNKDKKSRITALENAIKLL